MPSDPKHMNLQRIDHAHPQADGYAVANPPTTMPQPFEPRLILPDPPPLDDQGELDLPDDLTALAEQLQDDAAYLSNCHPPPSSCASSAPRCATAGLTSSASMRVAVLTAASIALALSLTIVATRKTNLDRAELTPPVYESTAQPKPRAALDSAARDQLHQLDQTESLLLLREASGPEREGLLDLLQQTAQTETSISF